MTMLKAVLLMSSLAVSVGCEQGCATRAQIAIKDGNKYDPPKETWWERDLRIATEKCEKAGRMLVIEKVAAWDGTREVWKCVEVKP